MPHLLLYDGVCGLCNRLIQFVLRRDRRDRFRFAALQGPLAADVLRRYGRDPNDLDTVYVLAKYGAPNERLLWKGRAVAFALTQLGGFWSVAHAARVVPTRLLDFAYAFVAQRRYGWFGKLDACLVPSPQERAKFLDVA